MNWQCFWPFSMLIWGFTAALLDTQSLHHTVPMAQAEPDTSVVIWDDCMLWIECCYCTKFSALVETWWINIRLQYFPTSILQNIKSVFGVSLITMFDFFKITICVTDLNSFLKSVQLILVWDQGRISDSFWMAPDTLLPLDLCVYMKPHS